ncbi:methyltransferase [Methanoregula sp.]|uniref:methyltransferase n=1 Tax=Methanoregula sp. TaxID=2052170 RepID=UPI003C752088
MNPDIKDIKIGEEISSIDTIVDGYKTYQVIRAALELGLFEWLDVHGSTPCEELGNTLSINGMFTRSFFQTLVDLGFLQETDDRFENTKITARLLVQKSPAYQGNWILNAADENGPWSALNDTLVGFAPKNTGSSKGPDLQFLKAMGERSLRGEVQEVTRLIAAWEGFGAAKKLLDIGGGHGLYAIAACQQNPDLRAVVLDKPRVIDLTREFIRNYGMEDRIRVVSGDIMHNDPGTGYDIVIISHHLYKFRTALPMIFGKVASSLRPRGLFVSNHWFCGPVCGTGSSGIRELDRSFQSYGHPLCHPEDFANGMFTKGLVITKRITIPGSSGASHVHLAEKVPEGCSPLPGQNESCGCRSCQ